MSKVSRYQPDYVNNYLTLTRNITHLTTPSGSTTLGWNYQLPRDQLICEDGFIISVQAGGDNHCTPKNNEGPWTAVECMLIKGEFKFKKAWEATNDGHGVNAYVNVALVNSEIHAHGGIAGINKR